jgi:hypothetical protein
MKVQQQIVKLRNQGISQAKVAEMLGIARQTVCKYSPPSRQLANRPAKARNDWLLPHDEYADVVPIPFYPPDLPVIRLKPLKPHQLRYVFKEQDRILFADR